MVCGRLPLATTMPQEWITDRPPTEADGDKDGDVLMRRAPDRDGGRFIHWTFVPPGMDWQHSSFWQPPTEPDRIAALEQRVAELEATMRPTAETFEQPELSYQRAKAEQLRSEAALLLAEASLVEAGQ